MNIRVKLDGKFVMVDVAGPDCKNLKCLSPHKYQHSSGFTTSMSSSDIDKHYSCAHRNYHGCPSIKIKKEKL